MSRKLRLSPWKEPQGNFDAELDACFWKLHRAGKDIETPTLMLGYAAAMGILVGITVRKERRQNVIDHLVADIEFWAGLRKRAASHDPDRRKDEKNEPGSS